MTPEYLKQVVPILEFAYYDSIYAPLYVLLQEPLYIFSCLLLIIYITYRSYFTEKTLLDLLALNTFSMFFVYFLQRTLWYYHMLPIAMLSSLLLFLLIGKFLLQNNLLQLKQLNLRIVKITGGLFVLLSFTVFIVAFMTQRVLISFYLADLVFSNPLYKIVKTIPNKPIYIFTSDINTTYPLVDYTNTYSNSLFSSLWLLNAASLLEKNATTSAQLQHAQNILNFIRDVETQALIKEPPVYIFIKLRHNFWIARNYTHFVLKSNPSPAYLQFFLQNPQFATFWQQYEYQGTQDNFMIYKYYKK